MNRSELNDLLERSPIIAAIPESKWDEALCSPVSMIFYLQGNLLDLKSRVEQAHKAGKPLFIHIDLAEGIGRDRAGIKYMVDCGVDGLISTHGNLIRIARECGLLTVQRFFALDSMGMGNFEGMRGSFAPDLIEIMPGVINKVIERYSKGSIPVIAGGLIETKAEVTSAIMAGATAVSTGMCELWYM